MQAVSYSDLLDGFWSCHDTTIRTWNRQNGTVSACPEHNPRIWQYRSAIFTHTTEQAHLADLAIAEHQTAVPVRSLPRLSFYRLSAMRFDGAQLVLLDVGVAHLHGAGAEILRGRRLPPEIPPPAAARDFCSFGTRITRV